MMAVRTLIATMMLCVAALAGCIAADPASPPAAGLQAAKPAAAPRTDAPAARRPATQQKEEGFAILMFVFGMPDHVNQALRYKQNTQADTKWANLYVVHKEGLSELYRGNYPNVTEARKDLKAVKNYRTPRKVQPYKQALVMPLAGKEVGPDQWNLQNATGAFTLAIGLFRDDPARGIIGHKQFAVDNVRDLRSKGIEAYFLHEPTQSLVTVGSFPESSYPIVPREVRTVERKVKDPKLEQLMRKYPFLAVNGYQEIVTLHGRDGKERSTVTGSYILPIPVKDVALPVPPKSVP